MLLRQNNVSNPGDFVPGACFVYRSSDACKLALPMSEALPIRICDHGYAAAQGYAPSNQHGYAAAQGYAPSNQRGYATAQGYVLPKLRSWLCHRMHQ